MISEKMMNEFDEFCKKNNITAKNQAEKFAEFQKIINKYLYEPGEAVGIVAAQSISEPATQMTMRSYTLASQSDRLTKVTQGLPRLIEIFDARKMFEKNMTIYLEPKYNTKEKAKEVAMKIKEKKIENIIKSDSIDLVNMRVEIELEKKTDKEHVLNIIKANMKDCAVSSKSSKIYLKPKKDDVKSLRKTKEKLLALHVYGIKNIKNIVIIKEDKNWIIQTAGTNLNDVIKVKEVDIKRTTTNDINQIYDVYGIEAARNVILMEAKKTLDEQGLEIDLRHLILLADIMTLDGEIKAVGRYGISGKKESVIARANFEETKRHIVNASFYGETDKLKGIIENVIVGQIAPIGTGMVNLTVDPEKLKSKK